MAINIFLSVGRPFSASQEQFVSGVENYLTVKGLRPRTVGRNEFTYKQPLQLVDDLMDRCAGALVIALERIFVETAVERRGSANPEQIRSASFSTPWNQVEAAFGYAKHLPLFVIKEHSVREEGLLERRYDWYVHSTDLNTEFLDTAEFKGIFDSWLKDVRRRAGWFRFRS